MKFKLKNKFKNIYKIFPVFFAFIFICFISVLLLNIKDDEAKILDTPEFLVSSINDFSSLKKTNEISYLMDNYKYYESYSDVLKTIDGYIFIKNIPEDDKFYTYVVKYDFSGTELWSYKYLSNGNDYRNNIVLFNDKIYLTSTVIGTLVLNENDGSVYKRMENLLSFDILNYNNNLLLINYDEVVIVDSELNTLKIIKSESLSNDEYKIYFDDFYADSNNVYILSTKEKISDDTYSPVIYTLDSELSFVSELPVVYDENQGFLSENEYYEEYFNFIKDGDNFYQVGRDVHKIDKNGNDNVLVNSSEINEHKDMAIIDMISFDDFYITLDSLKNYKEDDYYPWDGHIFLNIRDKDFKIIKQYSVNDYFIQYYALPESLNLVDGNLVVKWFDWATYESYISEFEFSTESDMCTVVSGTGSDIGDEIKCGEEEFYVLENDGVNVKMMGKYNLLVGSNYEKFLLDEPYVAASYSEIEDYLLSLTSFRDKLASGYILEDTFYSYDSTNGTYTLTGALLSHNLEYKTGTVLCESGLVCAKEELLNLAIKQGYFQDDTQYYFINNSDNTGVFALEFSYYEDEYWFYTYHLFDEPVASITEALADSEVRKKITNDSSFDFITLEDGSIFGIAIDYSDYNDYEYLFLDEPVSSYRELLKVPEIVEYLDSGYSINQSILDGDNYVAVRFTFDSKNLRTIVFENDYTSIETMLKSDEMAVYLDQGYYYSSALSNDGVYIGAKLYKYDDRTYKTILFDEARYTEVELYQREDIKLYLDQGYFLTNTYRSKTTYYCSKNSFCDRYAYGVALVKYIEYDYLTIVLDEYDTTVTEVKNNQAVLDSIAEGYEYYSSVSTMYYKYDVAEDGTVTSSHPYYYVIAILRKATGNSLPVIKEDDDYVPYIMEKLQPSIVRQDETAIGAHGDESGAPEPFEIGVVEPMYVWGEPISYPYSGGYIDYSYYTYSGAYRYYHSYYSTLKNDGFNVLNVDSITVSEINEIVNEVTGSELPLEEWYYTSEEEGYDYVTENGFYILGSIKELMPDGYDWLWGTTYWTRTSNYSSVSEHYSIVAEDTEENQIPYDIGSYIYFIDTLGDLCLSYYCQGAVGAGLRPVVTMSLSSIEFNVTTSTDGNGVVNSSHVSATSGDIITFNVTPNEGYILESITVTDELGNSVVYTDYKFTMPAADVNIDAKFQEKIYFEPEIELMIYNKTSHSLGDKYSFNLYVDNPYDFPLYNVKIVTNSYDLDKEYDWNDVVTFEENVIYISELNSYFSGVITLNFPVDSFGYQTATAEIVEAVADEPYFFNEEKDYFVTDTASSVAGVEICNILDGEGDGSINQYQLLGYDDENNKMYEYWLILDDNACKKITIPTDFSYTLTQIEKQNYTFVNVSGHIDNNGELFDVEPEKYKITFYNKYNNKGYFKSWNRKENDFRVYSKPN